MKETFGFRFDKPPHGHEQTPGKRQFAVRLDPETYEFLCQSAKKADVSVSGAARLVLKNWAQRKGESA